MAKIKLNGKDVEVPAGKPLLQGCLDAGAYVPHYCYHPGLTPAGNCRMCLVKVSNSRKLERSEEHTSELQSQSNLVCRLLLEKKIRRISLYTSKIMLPVPSPSSPHLPAAH